ncbi:MAG: carotenoid biosynthesis protein [Nitrososphaerota archaeon]|nr:carotenoid biosynthesis protein [Nitrososphaerota archaeon]
MRIVVHALLLLYAGILAYILLGLIFQFNIAADIFFDLSFALLFFSLGQAFYEMGVKKALTFIAVTALVGFAAEVLGTSTGFPFGQYYYTDFLGPKILGVPEVVPLVWFVISYLTLSIAYGAFSATNKLNRRALTTLALFCAFGAVAWDFLIDPMFSSYGYWVWTGQFVDLPKLYGIPLTKYGG